MKTLFAIKKLNYQRVNYSLLPVKPDNNPEFVYTGRKRAIPDNLHNYLKGGWRYSEERRKEILRMHNKRCSIRRVEISIHCRKLLDAIFPPELCNNM